MKRCIIILILTCQKSMFIDGFESGFNGWKAGSNSSSYSFGTTEFRSTVFSPLYSHPPIFTLSRNNTTIITSFNKPVIYDNREYYWNSVQARDNILSGYFCGYQIGEDDGDLRNATFSDRTPVKFLYFACQDSFVHRCGMYCCHSIGDYLLIGLGATSLIGISLICALLLYVFCRPRKTGQQQNNAYGNTENYIPPTTNHSIGAAVVESLCVETCIEGIFDD